MGTQTRLRRGFKRWNRRLRELRMIAGGLLSTRHPIMAHLIATRRCNLACGYCNEYDRSSPPVPIETLIRRAGRLAGLGTRVVTISGGEPLLHPGLEQLVASIRSHGMIAGLITNGYLLTPARIRALNEAELDHLQISIDNVRPGPVSVKSLKVLDPKLRMLAEHAEFHVNINSVIGACADSPEDALTVARRAVELGFTSTVGILHDSWGQVKPLAARERQVYEAIKALAKRSYARFNGFRENLAAGKPNEWRCRAGARYLYVCEDGLVHYCSQQRGYPGVPLEEYSHRHIRREFETIKSCAPWCTVSCVHQVSTIDRWRAPQRPRLSPGLSPGLAQIKSAPE